jgi:hypothetical protein
MCAISKVLEVVTASELTCQRLPTGQRCVLSFKNFNVEKIKNKLTI